jgi:prepilin-type N-terminal cleavage/methylation domain-containing protein
MTAKAMTAKSISVRATPTKARQGLSMIEILIVLAVLGILLSIGGFMFNAYLQQLRLNEATRVTGETLRRVSELAVTESQSMIATLTGTTIAWREAETNIARGSVSLPTNTALTSSSANITFSGRGLPEQPETFAVTLNGKTRNVFLLTTGAVTYP